jgi:hypothetical protein
MHVAVFLFLYMYIYPFTPPHQPPWSELSLQ